MAAPLMAKQAGAYALAKQGKDVQQGPANYNGKGLAATDPSAQGAAPQMAQLLGVQPTKAAAGYMPTAGGHGGLGGGPAPMPMNQGTVAANARNPQASDRPFAQSQLSYQQGQAPPVQAAVMQAPNPTFGAKPAAPPAIGKAAGPAVQPGMANLLNRPNITQPPSPQQTAAGMGPMGVNPGQQAAAAGAVQNNGQDSRGTYVRGNAQGETGFDRLKQAADVTAQTYGQLGQGAVNAVTNSFTGGDGGSGAPGGNPDSSQTVGPTTGGDLWTPMMTAATDTTQFRPGGGGSSPQSPVGKMIQDLVGQAGADLGGISSTMTAGDMADANRDYGGSNGTTNVAGTGEGGGVLGDWQDQEQNARDTYGSDARQKAEDAAREDLNYGVNAQKNADMRTLMGQAGRGGAVGTGAQTGIYNTAANAIASGERGLAQDKFGRDMQASSAFQDAMNGIGDRRAGLIGDTRTTRKDALSMILEGMNPLSSLIPG